MGRKIGRFGLVNYKNHPTNSNYVVFNFNSKSEADLFEQELNNQKVQFEKDTEEINNELIYLFAIKEALMEKAAKANYAVSKAHKQPLVKNKFLRYALLLFVGSLLIFAIIGYVKNSTKIANKQSVIQSDSTNFE